MKTRINLISIITPSFTEMKNFYNEVIGFEIKLEMDNYIEFENEGVRFAISTNDVMFKATGHESYKEESKGHQVEFAFESPTPAELDKRFEELVSKGAKLIMKPEDMPWGQRAGFFGDPDGNIHEVFCKLSNG